MNRTQLLPSMTSDLMTSPEAVFYLRISQGTLRHWVCGRKIEFIKIGRSVRFRKAHLERFISEKLQETIMLEKLHKDQAQGVHVGGVQTQFEHQMSLKARAPKSLNIQGGEKCFPEIAFRRITKRQHAAS